METIDVGLFADDKVLVVHADADAAAADENLERAD